jgi:hypothetical protein
MKPCLPVSVCVLWSLCGGAQAQPLSTAFTYQGRLLSEGAPTEGAWDLRFRLYDAAVGGGQVGTTLCVDNSAVADGRFTVVLDFFQQFAGQKRYLEVEVRADTGLDCTSGSGFTLLSPRQELTATPNAVFALNAGTATQATTATSATNATTALNATNAANAAQLNGQSASFYQSAANLTSGVLPSARLGGSYTGVVQMENAGNTFAGAGGGLFGLNASNISVGTLSAARLPIPMTLSGTSGPGGSNIVSAENTSPSSGATALFGTTSALTGQTYGVQGRSASTSGSGVLGVSTALTGVTTGVAGQSDSPNGRGVRGVGGAFGGVFESFGASGIGAYGAGAQYGGFFSAQGGGTNWGVFGESASATGTAVRGVAWSPVGITYGVLGRSESVQGYGVYGEAAAAGSFDVGVGGYFVSHSGSGAGVYGLATGSGNGFPRGGVFRIDGTAGAAIDVVSTNTNGNGYGVRAASSGLNGTAVYGSATLLGTGLSYGGRFESASTGGFAGYFKGRGGDAVYIENTAAGRGLHVISPSDTAVWAESSGGLAGVHGATANINGFGVLGVNSGTTGNSFGVVGETASGAGWGVYAFGRSGASGVKTFRIDHPADPENKYLLHYSTEGPEVLNAYSGTAMLDDRGEADVELPAYFARINKDPRYTLTPVGAPMPMLHIGGEVSTADLELGAKAAPEEAVPTCRFRIAGGAPGAKVCWRVEAVRNDRWVQRHGVPVEVEKEGVERGTYQEPELYGRSKKKGVMHTASSAGQAPR